MGVNSGSDKLLRVTDLGRMAYRPALEVQRRVNQGVIDGVEPGTLLLVEHEPVITVSHRRSAAGNVVASADRLAALGIEVAATDRGGDVTYHGPGQLVAYPIVRMDELGLNLSRYMRFLEDVVIDVLAGFGVEGVREEGATGVWVRRGVGSRELGVGKREEEGGQRVAKPRTPEARGLASGVEGGLGFPTADCRLPTAKVCAMGVRVRKNVTMHGLALNVTTDLSHFGTIVPCGLAGRPVTSLRELLVEACPSMDEVKRALVASFERRAAALRVGRLAVAR